MTTIVHLKKGGVMRGETRMDVGGRGVCDMFETRRDEGEAKVFCVPDNAV